MPSGGGSDYMLKVGADFSGVIQELSKVESFAKSTEGGLLAPPTSGAKPFATVTEGTRYSGRTVAVSEVAREQAERIAIQMQDGILRSVKANEMSWARAREFKPDDAKLKEIGTAYASKLRLAGEEMQSFVASFTSQVQAMFGPKSVWGSKVIGTNQWRTRKNLDEDAIAAFQGSAKGFESERKAYLTSVGKRTTPASDETLTKQRERVGRALIAALEEEVKASYENLSTAKKFDIIRRRAILALQGEDFKGYRGAVNKALASATANAGLNEYREISSADIGSSRVKKMSKQNLDLEVQANAERAIADMSKGLIALDELGLYLQSMAHPGSNWGRQQYGKIPNVRMAEITPLPSEQGDKASDIFDADEAAAQKLGRAQQEAAALMQLVTQHLAEYVNALKTRTALESLINSELQSQVAMSPGITAIMAKEARERLRVGNVIAGHNLADPLYLTASSDQGLLKRQQEAASKLTGLKSSTEPDIASRAASLEQRSLAISGDILKSGEITADIRNRINSLLNDSMGLIQADNAIQRQIAASDTFAKEAAIRNANTAAERASLGAVGKASYAMSTPVVGDVAQELHKSGGRRELGLDPTLEIEAYRIYIDQLKADLKSSAATRSGVKKIDDELYIAKQNELKVAEASLTSIKAAAKRQEVASASRGGDRSLRPDIAAARRSLLASQDLAEIAAAPAASRTPVSEIASFAALDRDQKLTLLEKGRVDLALQDKKNRTEAEIATLLEEQEALAGRLVSIGKQRETLNARHLSTSGSGRDVVAQRSLASLQAKAVSDVDLQSANAYGSLIQAQKSLQSLGANPLTVRLERERRDIAKRLIEGAELDKLTQDRINYLSAEIAVELEKRKIATSSANKIATADLRASQSAAVKNAERAAELEYLGYNNPYHAEAKSRIALGEKPTFYSEEFGQYSRMSQEGIEFEGQVLAAQKERLRHLQATSQSEEERLAIDAQITAVKQQEKALLNTRNALLKGEFVDTNALQAYRQTALARIGAGAVTPALGAGLSAEGERAVMQQIISVLNGQLNDETVVASLTEAQVKSKEQMLQAARAALENTKRVANAEAANALLEDRKRALGETHAEEIAAQRGVKPTPTSPEFSVSTLLQEQEILKAQLDPLKREFESLPKGDVRRDALGKDIALIDGAIAESKRHISASVARELEARRSIEAMTEAEYAATALVANKAIESGQIPAGLSSTEHAQLMAVIEQEVIAEIARLQNIQDSVVATESINALENQHRALLTMSNEMLKKEAAANSTSTMARMRNAGGAGGFFAGGLMSTIRYGLPSMALFGAFSGFKNLIKESEELQYNMAILEDQFKAVFSDTDFGPVRGQITALARETGLQADQIAQLRVQITGAFSAQSIKGMGGPTLVEEQTEAAAKMAQTLKIPLAEINDGLQAASLNFHVLYEDIGDVATALEQRSGVLAKEIVSFVGDTAPVFKEAGYSMQETAAIAAVSAQRSGRSGTAIAEAFGRVIPALTENSDKLRELAAIEPSLATPKFLDALRTSNVKDIFDEVGRAYNQMSVEGQQTLVQALGGRREAHVILPALTNRTLIEEYTKAADDSAGTLEERFKRIQGTLTNAMQRLGEYIKTLGVDLMDAGLEDVFTGAIDAAKVLVSTLSPLLKAVTTINDAFGKWPIRILAAVGAFKAFNALMMVGDKHILASGINRLLFGSGVDGAVAVGSLRAAFTRAADAGQAGGVMRALSERRALAKTVWSTGLVPLERGGTAWGAPAQFAAGTRMQRPLAMGKFLLPGGLGANAAAGEAAIAGSSALMLGGIAALAATAMAIKGAQDKNQKAWEDLKSKVDADLGSRNLDAPDVRKQAIEDMQHQADSLKKSWDSRSNLVKAWDSITAKSPDWEIYSMKARSLGIDEETSKMRSAISSSSILREKLMKMFNEEYGLSEDAFKGESTWSTLWGGQKVRMGGGTQIRTLGSRRNVDAVKKISDAMGFGYKMVDNELVFDMDKDVLKALGSEDPQAELQKLADGGDDVREGAQRQALIIMQSAEKLGKTDAGFNEMVAELQGLMDKLPPAEQAKADIQDLQKMLDLGLITADQYAAQAASRLSTLQVLATTGTKEENAKALISNAEQVQAAYKAVADHIVSQQTGLVDVYTTLGYSENATQNMAALYAVANLRDPKFRDPAARLEAAKTIIEVQRRTDMELAIKANDQARINELLTEGAEMSPEVKKVMFRNLFTQSGGEQSFINALNEGLQYAPKVPSKDYVSGDASKLLDDWLFEYQQFGKLSDKSFGDIKAILNGMMSARGGLDADALAQIDDGTKWIIQMLAYSGMSRDEILSALKPGSRPSTRGKFKDLIDQAFGGDNEFNKIQKQIKNMKILGNVDESMKQIEAQGELQKSLLRGSSVGAALIEASVAQQRLDMLVAAKASQTDIDKAQAEVNNANQKVREAMKGVADSESQLRITLLRNAGDTVGAARAEVEQAKKDLEWAKANNVDAVPGLQADLDTKLKGASQAELAKRSSLRDLAKTRAEINGDAIAAAEIAVQDAQDARNEARGDEIPAAQARLEQAQEEQRKARIAVQDAWFSLQSTMLTDPVEQAQAALTQAQQHLADARGDQAKLEAYGRVVESQRALNDAMASVRQSYYTLRQAELQAMGDDVGAAEVAAQAARDQLMEAVKNKKGDTEIRNLRAQVVTADKAAKDALFDEKMYDYKWMMDMGQITKGQYADYLEGLKSTLIPGTRQFKDLELTIKQLRDDIGSDLQHNLPTSLALPTLYEVRRLNQMQGSSMSAAMGGGIGYQDNRTQDIVVYVSNGMGAEEVVGVLQDALDGSRSGSGPRRY